jgi:hypothetical protein
MTEKHVSILRAFEKEKKDIAESARLQIFVGLGSNSELCLLRFHDTSLDSLMF